MRVVRTVAEMKALGGGDIGFVPTMGAFHEGHLALMRKAKSRHETLVVSLFVNPLQFGAGEDLAKYPRNEDRDFALARAEMVDYLFAPTREDIYPRESTTICVPEITTLWEGRSRPGHFDGVATVVAKLFNIVNPRIAYFGWKDLQQCLVIRRMTEDLNLPVDLEFLETVRDSDGLALSSRNAYLSPDERQRAPMLHETLVWMAGELNKKTSEPRELLEMARGRLSQKGFDVDYLEMVSLVDLTPTESCRNAALIVASKLGTTRLIDNLRLDVTTG